MEIEKEDGSVNPRFVIEMVSYQNIFTVIIQSQRIIMWRSQPKPKIIYRNLEDIMRGSSQTKPKQQLQLSSSAQKQSVRAKTIISCSEINGSSSRHRLNSKSKITYRDASGSNSKKNILQTLEKQSQKEFYQAQIQQIYAEMQAMLKKSKKLCLSTLNHPNSDPQRHLKKVETMSKLMKQILHSYLNGKKEKTEISTNNSRILTEISLNNVPESISMLSMQNQRKRKSNRLKNSNENAKKLTIYELVLMKKR